jgi:hypothetical protein
MAIAGRWTELLNPPNKAMKKNILILATIAALAPCLSHTTNAATGPCAAAPQVYDLKTDWSDTQNPNGTWSYRSTDYGELFINDPYAWLLTSDPEDGWIKKSTSPIAVPGVLEVGDSYISLGGLVNGIIVRWTVPASGTITISAALWDVHVDRPVFAPATPWQLLHNGGLLTEGSVPRGLLLDVPVQAGDSLDLNCFFPSWEIGINFTITLTPDSAGSFAEDSIIWHQPLARNGASEDTDPSAGRTVKYRFKRGSTIPIQIHALNCAGADVTSNANVIGKVTVFGDSNCDGAADANADPIEFNGVGGGGGVMDKIGGHLKYNLDTESLPTTTQCYILRVTVTDTSTGEEKSEEVLLQAK